MAGTKTTNEQAKTFLILKFEVHANYNVIIVLLVILVWQRRAKNKHSCQYQTLHLQVHCNTSSR
jgi:hypothetical protein